VLFIRSHRLHLWIGGGKVGAWVGLGHGEISLPSLTAQESD
jgi:hypothetical protein